MYLFFIFNIQELITVDPFDLNLLTSLSSYQIPFSQKEHGDIRLAAVKRVAESVQLYLTSADGSVFSFKDSQLKWSRDESMSDIVASTFVHLPMEKKNASPFNWNDIPQRLHQFIFPSHKENLSEFEKARVSQYWIAATSSDTLVALDAATGEKVWRIYVPGCSINHVQVVKELDEPIFNAIGSTSLQVNALTGEYTTIWSQPAKFSTILNLRDPESQLLISAFVDSNHFVSIYPNSTGAIALFEKQPFYFYMNAKVGSNFIQGYKVFSKMLANGV
jgi:hypothetical protein